MSQSCCHPSAVLGPAAPRPLPSPSPGPHGDATAPQLWAPRLGGQWCGRLAKWYRAHPWVTKQTTFPLGAAVPSCRLGHPLAAWQGRPDFNILLNDGHWIHLRTVLRGKQLSMEGRARALHVWHSQMGPKAARPPPCPPPTLPPSSSSQASGKDAAFPPRQEGCSACPCPPLDGPPRPLPLTCWIACTCLRSQAFPS